MPEPRIVVADTDRSTPRTAVLEDGTVALSIDEVATVLRVNRKTVVAMIDRGELAEVRYARRRWVPTHVLRTFLLLDPPDRSSIGPSRT
jgi:excisionase family DNA binding protein